MPGTVLTTAPATEPVTAAEAKTHLRVDHSDEDTYISSLITAARQSAERFTSRQFITATWKRTLDVFPGCMGAILLPHPPLLTISSIKYYDDNGTLTTLAASVYQADTAAIVGYVLPAVNEEWPTTQSGKVNAVEITYTAGYGDATAVPTAIKQALLLTIGHWYENRETVNQGAAMHEMPMAATYLLTQYSVPEY